MLSKRLSQQTQWCNKLHCYSTNWERWASVRIICNARVTSENYVFIFTKILMYIHFFIIPFLQVQSKRSSHKIIAWSFSFQVQLRIMSDRFIAIQSPHATRPRSSVVTINIRHWIMGKRYSLVQSQPNQYYEENVLCIFEKIRTIKLAHPNWLRVECVKRIVSASSNSGLIQSKLTNFNCHNSQFKHAFYFEFLKTKHII